MNVAYDRRSIGSFQARPGLLCGILARLTTLFWRIGAMIGLGWSDNFSLAMLVENYAYSRHIVGRSCRCKGAFGHTSTAFTLWTGRGRTWDNHQAARRVGQISCDLPSLILMTRDESHAAHRGDSGSGPTTVVSCWHVWHSRVSVAKSLMASYSGVAMFIMNLL